MRKLIITCDCCGKEIEENKVFSVEHYVHVSPSFNRMQEHVEVIEGRSYKISRRTEKKEFCLPCYNDLFSAFFTAFELHKSSKNTDLPY